MNSLILKHVLKNSLEHGKAQVKSVVSKVLGEDPKLRKNVKKVVEEISTTINTVDAWPENKKKKELLKLWPNAFEKKEEKEKCLPELKGKNKVFRFAPNPNGAATLGSSRGIVINGEYAKKNKGIFICRFDDTDPGTKRPLLDAYEWYVEDITWLGYKPDKVVILSDRLDIYYKRAAELIDKGVCYVCSCKAEKFQKLKAKAKPCPHRGQDKAKTKQLWEKMLSGKMEHGDAVLKIKTDLKNPNPAVRDWTCFRIIKIPHPLTGEKYCVWPLLDFAGAIEDHEQKVTNIIRGKDLRDSTTRQKYLYDYMGWTYPVTNYWGRVAVHEFGKLSTSGINKRIKQGEFFSWDDPRVPSIRALRRRGFKPEALREFWFSFGLSEKDVSASMRSLEAVNKKYIEESDRYYFVPNPKKIVVKNIPELDVKLKKHPEKPGIRAKYKFKGENTFYVPEIPKKEFRLKGAFNVKAGKYSGRDLKPGEKLQWVDANNCVDVEVMMPDASIIKGKAEKGVKKLKKGTVVQFERFGFVRIDLVGRSVKAWFTHK